MMSSCGRRFVGRPTNRSDIVGTVFEEAFVAWGGRNVESKALTTHQNLWIGFNEHDLPGRQRLRGLSVDGGVTPSKASHLT
jgi:hypothetical protein